MLCLLPAARTAAQDPFADIIRQTDPLTAEEQLETFHLAPGFEIQLVAAEPEIQKPMNLAFDGRGRLWVSGSVEYPFAAEPGAGRDTIRILEDTTGDGRADKITTFADGLNIPIGLYPYRDGVVVYSIPNIYFMRDTDGDGRADQRDILYGPLDLPVDTHGMQNAFRRGFDGWLYINHGFRNDTTITGSDGSAITLNSGNTYRVTAFPQPRGNAYRVPASKLTRKSITAKETREELEGLDTTIDWKNTGDNSYDGEKLKLLVHDESGKWKNQTTFSITGGSRKQHLD